MTVLTGLLSVYNWWQISKGGTYFASLMAEAPFKHLYSLAIEAQFYLIWPLFLLLAFRFVKRRSRLIFALLGLALLSALAMGLLYRVGQDPTRVYYGTDTRLFSILLGGTAALAFPSRDRRLTNLLMRKPYISEGIYGFALLVLGICLWLLPDQSPMIYRGGMLLFSLLSAVIVVMATENKFVCSRVLSHPVLTYLGERSYGLYLWQMPLFTLFALKVKNPHHVLSVLGELLCLSVITEIFYRLVEKPMRTLSWQKVRTSLRAFFASPATVGNAFKISIFYVIVLLVLLSVHTIIQSPDLTQAQDKIAAQLLQNEAKDKMGSANRSLQDLSTLAKKFNVKESLFENQPSLIFVGDSMIAMTYDRLREAFPNAYIDGKNGRSAQEDGISMLTTAIEAFPEADKIVVSLGINTDGPIMLNQESIGQMMSIVGERDVYWMTLNLTQSQYTWTEQVNQELVSASQEYTNLHLVDWHQATLGKETKFLAEDMTHPNKKGQLLYTKLLLEALAQ
ncbi:peptidoglycan/LPS O-acetylase OafA/YrhL [Streptococcus saliviloxodontae]|uniref:Peptidoglycan/LPS O-acetylase OafA/YrhL n=2 Tax=Streptococcus saliviloxodontae TaxID=1349416 RepID=A0ABS2PQH8_9STRE|nr:peptidoglycan/LPS O-acetylase OafA/YrhL [Streptococcus saliviloxodontae]